MATQELSNELFNIKEKLTQEEYKNLYDSLSKVNEEVNKNKLVELMYMEIAPNLAFQQLGSQTLNIRTDIKTIIVPLGCITHCYGGAVDMDKLKKRIGSGFSMGRNIENNFGRDADNTLSIKLGGCYSYEKSYMIHTGDCNGSDCQTEDNGYDSGCADHTKCCETNVKYAKNILISVEEYVIID